MRDRQTGSVWTHYDGSVLTGPLADGDTRLPIAPLWQMTWAEWQAIHPATTVIDWYDEYARNYEGIIQGLGRPGLGNAFEESLLNLDTRLPNNEMVLGVNIGTDYRAYPLATAPSLTVIADSLNGFPIVLFLNESTRFGAAYVSELDGQPLQFMVEDGMIFDASGTQWSLTGEAIDGPNVGASLPYVTAFVTEWYGWVAYHVDTGVYEP